MPRDAIHHIQFTQMIAPVACGNADACEPTAALDCSGFESNMIILELGVCSSMDWVLTPVESDTLTDVDTMSAIATGSGDVVVRFTPVDTQGKDLYGDTVQYPETTKALETGVVTLDSGSSSEGAHIIIYEYRGKKRYFGIQPTSGSGAAVASMVGVQCRPRHGPVNRQWAVTADATHGITAGSYMSE